MTQKDLERISGVKQSTISKLERGVTRRNVTAETMLAIAGALRTNADYLKTGRGSPHDALPVGTTKDMAQLFEKLTDKHKALMLATAKLLLEDQ